jgi:hypothetical protein
MRVGHRSAAKRMVNLESSHVTLPGLFPDYLVL